MNRPLAIALAVLLLLLAVLGGVVVVGNVVSPAPPRGPTAAPRPDRDPVRRHAATTPRTPPTVVPETPVALQPEVLPLPLRLPVPPGSGFIVGTVIDALTGDPVRDASLRLLHPTGEEVAVATSDSAGRYQIEAVPDGLRFVVEVAHAGHLTGHLSDVRTTDHEIVRKDVALLRAPRVRVTLRAMPWRRPAAAVRVRIMDGSRAVADGTTDLDGTAELAVTEMGRFGLRIGGGEWAPLPEIDLHLLPGSPDPEIRRDVVHGGFVAVEVRDSGAAAGGIDVSAHADGLEPVTGTTDGDGRALLGPLPPGVPFSVVAVDTERGDRRGATQAVVRDGHESDALITLEPAARLTGRVRDSSKRPVAGASVKATLPGGGAVVEVTTDAEGRFSLDGLPRGAVVVHIAAPGLATAERTADAGAPQSLSISLRDVPSARITGRVFDPRGAPLVGASIAAPPSGSTATTDATGTFELRGIAAGTLHRIVVSSNGLRLDPRDATKAVVTGLTDRERHRVSLRMIEAEPRPGGLDTAAPNGLLRITGRLLRDDDAAPVVAAQIAWGRHRVTTGPEGTFEIERPSDAPAPPPAALEIQPPEGLLESIVVPVPDADESGLGELGDLALRSRPSSLIQLARTPTGLELAQAVALLLDGDDLALGVLTAAFEGRVHVVYDGSLLHVAAEGAWRTDGRRQAWIGISGPVGPLVGAAEWPVVPGLPQSGRPEWSTSDRPVRLDLPREVEGGRLRLSWTAPSDGAPVERLGLSTEVELAIDSRDMRLHPLGRGTWQAEAVAPGTGGARYRFEIKDGRAGRPRRVP